MTNVVVHGMSLTCQCFSGRNATNSVVAAEETLSVVLVV